MQVTDLCQCLIICIFLYIFHLNAADSDYLPYIKGNANALLLLVHVFYFFRCASYNWDYKLRIYVSVLLLFIYVLWMFHLNVEDSDYQPYIKLNADVLLLIVHGFYIFSGWALLLQIISDGLMPVPYYLYIFIYFLFERCGFILLAIY